MLPRSRGELCGALPDDPLRVVGARRALDAQNVAQVRRRHVERLVGRPILAVLPSSLWNRLRTQACCSGSRASSLSCDVTDQGRRPRGRARGPAQGLRLSLAVLRRRHPEPNCQPESTSSSSPTSETSPVVARTARRAPELVSGPCRRVDPGAPRPPQELPQDGAPAPWRRSPPRCGPCRCGAPALICRTSRIDGSALRPRCGRWLPSPDAREEARGAPVGDWRPGRGSCRRPCSRTFSSLVSVSRSSMRSVAAARARSRPPRSGSRAAPPRPLRRGMRSRRRGRGRGAGRSRTPASPRRGAGRPVTRSLEGAATPRTPSRGSCAPVPP